MESLRFTSPQPSFLRPKFLNPIKPSNNETFNTAKVSPFVSATIASSSDEAPPKPPPLLRVSSAMLRYPEGFLGAVPDRAVTDGLNAMRYFTNIPASKVYDVAIESPLQFARILSNRLGVNIWLKREDMQPVSSFKLRGAYNMMAKLSKEQLERGVICSSIGNHGQGVALSAQRLGCNAVIAMPVTTPNITIEWKSIQRFGATVVLVGDSYDEAQAYAMKRGEEEGCTFIPPFDHPDVIVGQGTVGMEIVHQMQGPLHVIFVPMSGGDLIASIATYVKRVSPEVKIIGVEPSHANAMALSLLPSQRVMMDTMGYFVDDVAVKVVGEETFHLCRELIDGVVLVSLNAIYASIKDMFVENRRILEPAGALALAGAEAYCKYYDLKGENIMVVTSGANRNGNVLAAFGLPDVGRQQDAALVTFLPEEPGSFKRFCELVGLMNITEIKYRYNLDKGEALVMYSIGLHEVSDRKAMVDRTKSSKLRTIDLPDKDSDKDHLRYLMWGGSNVQNELFCLFVLPNRSDALMEFLDAFSPRWNITLFNYRRQEGKTDAYVSRADVAVGIQVARTEMDEFRDRANSLGFYYVVDMHRVE